MTKLYLSGGIANVPNFREIFQENAEMLEEHGYEVVNPLDVIACRDDTFEYVVPAACLAKGEPGTPGDPHSWACYLRYDLIAMLQCDGVAVIMQTFWNSKGAHLEEDVAFQCGLPRKSVVEWISDSINAYILNVSGGLVKKHGTNSI